MSQIITLQYNDFTVLFQDDASINATAIAKQFGKQPRDYLKQERTIAYMDSVKRIRLTEQNQLVTVKKGGLPDEQGTWIHKFLVVDFARWLNPDFAVWCDMQIESILQKSPYGLKERLDELNCPVYLTPNMVQHIAEEIAVKVDNCGVSFPTCYGWIHQKYHANSITTVNVTHYHAICNDLHVAPREKIPQYILMDTSELAAMQQAQQELAQIKADPTLSLPRDDGKIWSLCTNDDVILPYAEFKYMADFIESHQSAKDSIAQSIKQAFDEIDTTSDNIMVGRQRWNELNFIVKKVMNNPQALAIL